VGAKQISGTKEQPGQVKPYRHKKKILAIPANSLRGMLASVAETLSQSALRVVSSEEHSTYTVRKNVRDPVKEMAVLYKKGDDFYLHPLPEALRVTVYGKDKNPKDANFINQTNTFQNREGAQLVYASKPKNHTVTDLSFEADAEKIKGVLYIRGQHFNSKQNESFIQWNGEIDEKNGINVTQKIQALENTLRLYQDKDHPEKALPKGYQRDWKNKDSTIVQEGDLLYFKIENNVVTELSYSQIWRKPVNSNLHQALVRMVNDQDVLPWNKDRKKLTPAECIFGVVEDEPSSEKPARNLASRVQFTDAVLAKQQKVDLLPTEILKILDSPKPPSPTMYFHAENGQPISKRDLDLGKHNPNGRKHYVPQPEANNKKTWVSKFNKNNPPESKNWSQYLQCKPIPKDTEFSFDIHFENLSQQELGLLQIAIQPTNNDKFIHRLGLGKPLGLGQIKLKVDKTQLINKTERYSLNGLKKPREVELTKEPDDSLINQQTWEELKTLYNPDNIKYPVCYPFNGAANPEQKPYWEGEGFSWFVENEKAGSQIKQQLKPVKANKEIPVLKSFKND
jgi:CRISPR-associated protein (TIGR03986 family)